MKNILRFFTILLITANLISSVDISKKNLRSSVIYGCPNYHYEFHFAIPDADINGDGYKDIIGQSIFFDGWPSFKWVLYGSEEGFPEETSMCEYNGRVTLIDSAQIWFFEPAISAGDYNGDGYDDVVIGINFMDYHTDIPETWILYGGADWPEIINFWDLPSNIKVSKIRGRSAYSYLGEYILTEDINEDGYDDLILSERIIETESFKFYIFYGAPNGLPEYIQTSNLSENTITFNTFVFLWKAGDINGDNLMDLIFNFVWDGFNNDRKMADSVLILYNSTSGFPAELLDPINPPENSTIIYGAKEMDRTGYYVLFKDIDLDGFKDLIISASGAESLDGKTKFVGKVWILYGSSSGFPKTIDLLTPPEESTVIYGSEYGDCFGETLEVGDINNDGYPDIISSDPAISDYLDGGKIWFVYGNGKRFPKVLELSNLPEGIRSYKIDGEPPGNIGYKIKVTDIDNDGFNDVLHNSCIHLSGTGYADYCEFNIYYWSTMKLKN